MPRPRASRSPSFGGLAGRPFLGLDRRFEPAGADMMFERDRPSCYSSLRFGEVMSDSGSSLAGESACLATAIDAFHRGHRITYLDDASPSHTLDEIAAPDVHRVVSKVLGVYAEGCPNTVLDCGNIEDANIGGN